MNKQDLVHNVAEEHGLTPKEAENAVHSVLDAIAEALARGAEVKLSGFGTFKRVVTQARTCRNPRTGATVEVPAGHRVKFKASSKLVLTEHA